ncbi:multiple epidermal growth factor-like domains protein 6 [Haliotis rubra]|uniref:multiple epidermal growth factor-like domains protein 6 n=1 Tax=Haliotis rubra TaxID=36100 RepID=UPI001EE4F4ED|nr:multiple epidermal growth factor-like domains protein 6 [Haliotis rubra]
MNCSSQCNSKCLNTRCTNTGDCTDGCIPGYFGRGCESCPVGCWNNTCLTSSGSCTRGCSRGLYGQYCNMSCDVCLDGECLQMTGTCIKGCHVTGRGCNSTCRNCSIADCTAQSCEGENDESGGRGIQKALGTALVMFGFIIIMVICFGCLRRKDSKSEVKIEAKVTCPQEIEVRQSHVRRQARDSDHIYSDIDEDEMGPVIVYL